MSLGGSVFRDYFAYQVVLIGNLTIKGLDNFFKLDRGFGNLIGICGSILGILGNIFSLRSTVFGDFLQFFGKEDQFLRPGFNGIDHRGGGMDGLID